MKALTFCRSLFVALFLAGLVAFNPAQAAGDRNQHLVQSGGQQAAQISKDQAVDIVRSRFSGKVLGASKRSSGGRPVYHVKILTDDGRVRTVKVDGVSGRIL